MNVALNVCTSFSLFPLFYLNNVQDTNVQMELMRQMEQHERMGDGAGRVREKLCVLHLVVLKKDNIV